MGQAQAGDAVVMAIRRDNRSRANTAVGRSHEGKDSDVIVAGSAFYTASSSSVFACDRMLCDIWPVIDWREPIRLQERLKGRSSHYGEILRDVS